MSLKTDLLVCGGIDRATRTWLEARGIRVLDNLMGEAREVLSQVLKDSDEN